MVTDTKSFFRKLRFSSLMVASVFFNISTAQVFPDANEESLKEVDTFDARFVVTVWMDPSEDEDRFTRNGQSSLELGLRRDGVKVDSGAPNYLLCKVKIAESNSGLIFYSWDVEYVLWNPEGLNIVAWNTGGIATIGSNNFNAEAVATDCTNGFANTWLAQNPK